MTHDIVQDTISGRWVVMRGMDRPPGIVPDRLSFETEDQAKIACRIADWAYAAGIELGMERLRNDFKNLMCR